jgi:uncharacterized membrane protein
MKAQLHYLRDRLRRSFWLLPSLMALVALIAAPLTLSLDGSDVGDWLAEQVSLPHMNTDGARLILSTIAGSMMTVASLVFSMTLVTLTVAAGNMGYRLLDRYMGSRVNQVALGLFLATFVFALLILTGVHPGEDGVPRLSVVVTMALALASFGWLIYFVHHLASSIQIDNIVAEVAAEVTSEVRRFGTDDAGDESRVKVEPPDLEGRQPALEVPAAESGYLQTIDVDGLVALATKHDLLLQLLCRPGHFAIDGLPLVNVFGPVEDEDKFCRQVLGLMVFGPRRTAAQDVEFSLNLLVEIAARALSPGINDYFTAIACTDHIAGALRAVTHIGIPKGVHTDDDGAVRVLQIVPDFASFADAALDPMRQNARDNLPVTLRLLENLVMLAKCADGAQVREVLLRQGELITGTAEASARTDKDREAVNERYADLKRVLEA